MVLFPILEGPGWLCWLLLYLSIWLGIYFCRITNGPLRGLIGRYILYLRASCVMS